MCPKSQCGQIWMSPICPMYPKSQFGQNLNIRNVPNVPKVSMWPKFECLQYAQCTQSPNVVKISMSPIYPMCSWMSPISQSPQSLYCWQLPISPISSSISPISTLQHPQSGYIQHSTSLYCAQYPNMIWISSKLQARSEVSLSFLYQFWVRYHLWRMWGPTHPLVVTSCHVLVWLPLILSTLHSSVIRSSQILRLGDMK